MASLCADVLLRKFSLTLTVYMDLMVVCVSDLIIIIVIIIITTTAIVRDGEFCVCCYVEVPEQKLWGELPDTWSQPKLGKAVTLVELKPSDPEFMEVECNVRKTSEKSVKEIVSVCETCVNCLCLNSCLLVLPALFQDSSGEQMPVLYSGITGSAVALHCVKAHRQSQWRSPNFNPL